MVAASDRTPRGRGPALEVLLTASFARPCPHVWTRLHATVEEMCTHSGLTLLTKRPLATRPKQTLIFA